MCIFVLIYFFIWGGGIGMYKGEVLFKFNPIPIGFISRTWVHWGGGADLAPPPQISATNGPIDSKIGTVVKQVK